MPPTALINSIESVRKRARLLSVAYGVGIVLAAAAGLLVAVVLADYVLNLRSVPRVIVMLGSIGTLGYLAYRFVGKPAANRISLSDIAGRLEKAFPQFEDRLRSTVNFAEGANPGSQVLQQQVIAQAQRIASEVDLRKAVVAKPAALSVSGAIAAMLVLLFIAFGALPGNVLSIITSRLLTPFSGQAWPRAVNIELTSNLPQRVPVGQKIELSMKLTKGDKASLKPILYYQLEGGPRQQLFMTRGKDGVYAASLDARLEQAMTSGTLSAWIEAGDDSKVLNPIHIVPRLAIKQIKARVTPPAYVPNRNPAQYDFAAAPVVTAEGAEVAVSIGFNKELAGADPVIEAIGAGAQTPGITWTRDGTQTAVAMFRADKPFRFRVRATDVDGFNNTAMEEYELVVRPDANLTIRLENPRRSEERTALAYVPMQGVAEDDCGVEWVKLVVERLQPSPQKWEIPLVTNSGPEKGIGWNPIESTPERTSSRLNYKWELADLKLNIGDVIEYHLLARDNFNLDGRRHEPVASSKLRITIISQEELAARVTNDARAVKTLATTVRQTQQRTKQETQSLNEDTKDKENLDNADRTAAERLSQQQSATAASTKQLAQRMQGVMDRLEENRSSNDELKDITKTVKDLMERASEGAMKEATQDISNAAQPRAQKQERNDQLAKAQENQQRALEQLDQAMSKMDNIGSLQSTIAELAGILAEQKDLRKQNENLSKTELGKKPEQMSKPNKEKLDNIADKQQKLAERTEKALSNMQKQSKQMEKSDPSASEAMKSASQKAQDSKVSQSQQKASQQTKQNQQAGAQQSQQQAELGLEMALSELREAERRELARLREELAKLQEQIATLVRRQSGHNLDAVLLQPELLKNIDPKLMGLLTELSQRKIGEVKPIEPRQLSSGQELTERNTRDLGRGADAEPSTAAIGATLTKAAGKMERAIVSLRGAKIAEAYDPSQVEALALLLEARKQVDEQKKEADKKDAAQQKDAIRARYEKVKAEQEKLNAGTQQIEKSRDAKGNIPRTEWPTAAKLPKDELALAEEIAKIETDLDALGSIIYIWANRDIKNSMDQVKDDLLASKTGVPTQSEQTRIVEQLDAMIKNLAQEKKEEKFENAEGGGGGGGGGGGKKPTMPTEAELKLLKALQQAVNKSTTRIDAEKDKDQPKIVLLGNRQGELRNLLDNLLKKASEGQMSLGAEPDPQKDALPEEAGVADVEQQDINDLLLGEGAAEKKIEQDFKLVGTRMARSRQRLALNNDPGKTTQIIQEKILKDMDALIEMAKKNSQQQQQQSSSSQQQGQKEQKEQAANQGQNQPGEGGQESKSPEGATQAHGAGAGSKPRDLKDIRESAAEWGNVTPRLRDAVIESKGETVIEQYRKLIDDYYEALSKQGSRREP